MPKQHSSQFIPIAPHPGSPVPAHPQLPHSIVARGQTTRTRGPTGRFASLAGPVNRLCSLCGRTETSQWRTGGDGQCLCNACGIRLNRKPVSRKRAPSKKPPAPPTEGRRRVPKIDVARNNFLATPRKRQDAYRLETILNPQ